LALRDAILRRTETVPLLGVLFQLRERSTGFGPHDSIDFDVGIALRPDDGIVRFSPKLPIDLNVVTASFERLLEFRHGFSSRPDSQRPFTELRERAPGFGPHDSIDFDVGVALRPDDGIVRFSPELPIDLNVVTAGLERFLQFDNRLTSSPDGKELFRSLSFGVIRLFSSNFHASLQPTSI
jgi:hypothetical protein